VNQQRLAARVAGVAAELLDAEADARARDPLTDTWPDLSLSTAYAIADEALRRRVERGETIVGIKLGLTSAAKQRRMGVSAPLVAWLTDRMVLPAGTRPPIDRLIHPRAEPGIVFVMGERLRGPGVTAAAALAAVRAVTCGIEIIDSRFTDFRFTLPDVVADNASSAYFTLGSVPRAPLGLDLSLEACVLEVGGEVEFTATGAAVQGHPAEALAFAANVLAERDLAIEPGWIVLTGGLTDAVPLRDGLPVTARFSTLGDVHLPGYAAAALTGSEQT
jgi:2-oxo-3-hexenedioate decarboxylase